MVMGVLALIADVEPDPKTVDRLSELLLQAGFEDATDIAMLTEKMVTKILGGRRRHWGKCSAGRLKPPSPFSKGGQPKQEGGVERRGAGPGSVCLCSPKLPPHPFPATGEPPASRCLRWVRPWLAGKRAARHLVCIGPSVF